MQNVVIATHDGAFHADDVFSVALLKILASEAGAHMNVIRTRDKDVIKVMDIRIDVGGKWNEETLDFDHHQDDKRLMQPEGIKHATIGLLCRWCMEEDFLRVFKEKYLLGLEYQDNTGKPHPLYPSIGFAIQPFLPVYGQNEEYGDMFHEAVDIALPILERALMTTAGILRSEANLPESTLETLNEGKILVLKHKHPIMESLHPELCFTIVKDGDVYAFRSYNGHLVKEDFRGIKNAYQVLRKTGHQSVFIHDNGFTGAMKTLEGAKAICQESL